jgi:hypothetical protein
MTYRKGVWNFLILNCILNIPYYKKFEILHAEIDQIYEH